MKRRNNLTAYFAILVVCISAFFLLFRQKFPFGSNNTAFAVEPKTDISRIVFYEKDLKLVLSKNDEGDWVTGNNIPARDEAVSFLLKVLKEMKVKSPVTSETFTREIITKKIEPVKVNLYHKRRLKKSFFVYRTDFNVYGNIMKMKPLSKPFVIYIPGYEADIGSYFTANPLFWQPFVVFSFMPSEIEEIVLQNNADSSASFRILCKGKNISLLQAGYTPASCMDTARVRRYISYFTYVPFERWATDLTEEKKEEIQSSAPLYRIGLKTKDGKTVNLTLWQKFRISYDGKEVADNDRIWGKTDDTDELFIMRYFDIDPVLKKISYFCSE